MVSVRTKPKYRRKKSFNPDSKSKSVFKLWGNLPKVNHLKDGLVLDGYFLPDHKGFGIVIYDVELHRLVQWLDRHYMTMNRFIGKLPLSLSDKAIRYKQLLNPVTDSLLEISELVTDTPGKKYNSRIPKDYERVESNISPEQSYFQDRQLIPGSRIQIIDNKISTLSKDLDLDDVQDTIKEKLKGESVNILELAKIHLPVLESGVPDIKRVAFDIEIGSERGYFPRPSKAEYPVISVAFFDNENNSMHFYLGVGPSNRERQNIASQLGYMPEIQTFMDERKLLRATFELLKQYPMILSFNGDEFDLLYLKTRGHNLGISSPIYEGNLGFLSELHVEGTIHFDLMRFFKDNAIKNYAFGGKYDRYSLDDISAALLGFKKIDHDVWFDELNVDELAAYNVRDVELTLKLTSFTNNLTLVLIVTLMRICKLTVTYFNRQSISQWLFNWIAFEHKRRHAIIPSRAQIIEHAGRFESDATIEGKSFKGAIVFDPVPGIHWKVFVLDFASLYPSIIKTKSLSYDTVRCDHLGCKSNRVPYLNHWICLRREGIISNLVGFVRDIRVRWYKPRAKNSEDPNVRLTSKTIEAALKVIINGSFGVFGNKSFHLYCPPVAESTTAYARYAIIEAQKYAEELGLTILAGDTDSIFIRNPDDEALFKLKMWSIIKIGIELDVDYEFRFVMFSKRKKNYWGITQDDELILKGLQVKKRNTPNFIKSTFTEMTKLFQTVKDTDQMQSAIRQSRLLLTKKIIELKSGKLGLEDLAQVTTINEQLENYRSNSMPVQIAAQILDDKKHNDEEVKPGAQFITVRVRPFTTIIRTGRFKHLRLRSELACSVKVMKSLTNYSEVDVDKYYDLFKKAFHPILETLGVDWESLQANDKSLDEFF